MIDPADEPAFPNGLDSPHVDPSGLTKRELFAAMAMQGLLAANEAETQTFGDIAEDAVRMTDALIAELNKPKEVQS